MKSEINNAFIKIQKLTISDYNINSNNIVLISMFNNIEQIGYTLEISLNDISDIRGRLPIKGGETISLIFIDQYENKIKKDFILTRALDIAKVNESNQLIKLSAISKDSFYLSVKRDYSTYNNSISDVFKKYCTYTDNTSSSEKYQIIIPGFTYTKSIQYILNNFTKSNVFYEVNDKFEYSDINDLLIEGTNTYEYDSSNPYYRYNIVDSEELSIQDGAMESYKNIYKNNYVTFNPNTKSIDREDKTIETESLENNLQGTGKNYSEEIYKNINYKYNIVPYTSTALRDKTIFFKMFNKKFNILINGDLNLQVGQVIKIDNKLRLSNNEPSKLSSGDYIVTKVAHHITQNSFDTKIEVAKNSYFKEVDR